MKKMKKTLAILLAFVMVFTMASCGSSDKEEAEQAEELEQILEDVEKTTYDSTATIIFNHYGLGNNEFNDDCKAACDKAIEQLPLTLTIVETTSAEEYPTAITNAVTAGNDLIICVGSTMAGALATVAAENPNQAFAIIGANNLGSNVAGISFALQEQAFVVGIAAAMKTETNTVSEIYFSEMESAYLYMYAFQSGVATLEKATQIATNDISITTEPVDIKKIALAQNMLGADIIFQALGDSGQAVIDASVERGYKTVGLDKKLTDANPEEVLCSVVRKPDVAVFDLFTRLVVRELSCDDVTYSFANDGLAFYDPMGNFSEDSLEEINEYIKMIKDGDIVVPYDWNTMNDYVSAL